MLQPVVDVLKSDMRVASIASILLLVLVGVLLLYSKRRTWGRRWLVGVVSAYWFISTPLGAGLLMRGLAGRYTAVQSRSDVPGASAIVVLGGGSFTFRAAGLSLDTPTMSSAFRLLEAARVYKLLDDPLIIASGGVVSPGGNPNPEGEMLGKFLVDLGVPAQRVVYETQSRNTLEQASQVKAILQARHIDRFVLVTSPTHIKRSMAVFRAMGLRPYASVARVRTEGLADGSLLVPTQGYLQISDEAIYDCLALGYYWARGRL
jgi:uncharacterized SAM-binding protein YcdF (DUF218 family)